MNNFQLYELANLVANKDIYSNWLTPEQFELQLVSKNIRLMRDRLGLPERYQPGTMQAGAAASRIIESDLSPFLEIEELTVTEQELEVPDWYYINDFFTDDSIVPEIISQQELSGRIKNPLRKQVPEYPFAIIIAKGLKIWPSTVSKATVSYYREPATPTFITGINETSKELEYSTSSVELEWRDENKLDILHLILEDLGINIERQDLEQYAQKLVETGK